MQNRARVLAARERFDQAADAHAAALEPGPASRPMKAVNP
jgi:hypothetical protein